jgi:hypothetical protein
VLKTRFLFVIIMLAAVVLSGGCSTNGGIKSTPAGNTNSNSQSSTIASFPRGLTGTFSVGKAVEAASTSISPSGGNITVKQADSLINGLELSVPSGAYKDKRDFKISCAPIEKHSFGEDFNPITPLITVENGGLYSAEDIMVTVPVSIPQDKFAMGFIYNDKTKILEGMPVMAESSSSITVSTRHFSSFVISVIDKFKLKKDIDTSFRPGIDDWHFVNYGSYIAPKGHCAGQSISAMWYYYNQPNGKDLTLYGRYDNNGKDPATPKLWWDDSYGYRLASIVQSDLDWDSWASQFFTNQRGVNDELAWDCFAYSMQFLKQPQYVTLGAGEKGHAIICYRIKDGNLYVADPNYPGNTERRIEYVNNKFKPYESGANKKDIEDGKSISYTKIGYVAQSSRVDWQKMQQRWGEFKNGTIGNDKFPAYKIMTKDEKGQLQEIQDGYVSSKKYIYLGVKADFDGKIYVFKDGKTISPEGQEYKLDPGNNLLGIFVSGKINNAEQYVDYKYFNVKFGDEPCKNPPPKDILDKLQKTTSFKCELLNLPTTIEGKGSMQKWVPGFKFTKHFYVPGNAISVGGEGAMAIKWSGTSFSGGGTNGYPDKLTGNVCYNNGKLEVSFDYVTNDPKDNLIMSVKNLPCDPKYFMDSKYTVDGKSRLQYMNTEAPVVKGFVTTLEWTSHEELPNFSGPPEVWDAKLTAKDWSAKCGFALTFQ